jgi:tRNA(Ile)-lysidine synthase
MLSARRRDEAFAPFARASGLLLAVSGGPDSLALLKLALDWRVARGSSAPPVFAATVDHGLRAASRAEAQAVADACARLGAPHAILPWEGEKPLSRVQERARSARYALLHAHARALGADVVMTAHHLDDQAETLLMRMARGSGVAGLAGMRCATPFSGLTLARPLLDVTKEELVAHCAAHGLTPLEDPSNFDPRFARARIRRLSARLAAEGLTAQRLGELARRAARAEDALARAAQAAADRLIRRGPEGAALSFAALAEEPEEIGLRTLEAMVAGLAPAAAGAAPARLQRLEAAFERLRLAQREGRALRVSFAGAVLTLDRKGGLAARPEGPRRRGRAAAGEKPQSVHAIDEKRARDQSCSGASLGKGAARA